MSARSIALSLLVALLLVWSLFGRKPAPAGVGGVEPAAVRASETSAPVAAAPLESKQADAPVRSEMNASVPVEPIAELIDEHLAGASLEVRVLFEDEPMPGCRAELYPFDAQSGFLIGGRPPEEPRRAATDRDGVARFDDTAPGDWGILAATATGEECRTRFLLTPDARVARVNLALGSATLEGEVHDLDGRSAADTLVLARQNARPGEVAVWFAARTDAGGSYRIGGIAGGAGRSVLATVLDLPLGESLPFEMAAGEHRRLDFGSAGGRASWSGIVRFPSGAPVAGPARLFFTARANATSEMSSFDALGRFRVVLPPGEYDARLNGPAGLVLGGAAVTGATEQDLVVPRVVLRGRIRYVGTKHPIAKGPENDVVVTLERNPRGEIRVGYLRGESRYAYLGLEPGSYALTASPWVVAGTADGRAAIEIGPDADEVELDLSITDP